MTIEVERCSDCGGVRISDSLNERHLSDIEATHFCRDLCRSVQTPGTVMLIAQLLDVLAGTRPNA
jgi:hypothetical protein